MLIKKNRLNPGSDYLNFMRNALTARNIEVLPITPEIAHLPTAIASLAQQDPADRFIAATAIHFDAELITCDAKLLAAAEVPTVW